MRWPWVSRERLDESERFWCNLLKRSNAQVERVLQDSTGYVDRICDLVRENERLSVVAKESAIETKHGSTVSVGFPVGRTDGLVCLHIDATAVLLDDAERKALASLLQQPSALRRAINERNYITKF